jgi:hypothetical protein
VLRHRSAAGLCVRPSFKGAKARRRTYFTAGSLFRGQRAPLDSIASSGRVPRIFRTPSSEITDGGSCGAAPRRRWRAAGMRPNCQNRDRVHA